MKKGRHRRYEEARQLKRASDGDDIESLMEGGKALEIECDYCRKSYSFSQDQLRGLLSAN